MRKWTCMRLATYNDYYFFLSLFLDSFRNRKMKCQQSAKMFKDHFFSLSNQVQYTLNVDDIFNKSVFVININRICLLFAQLNYYQYKTFLFQNELIFVCFDMTCLHSIVSSHLYRQQPFFLTMIKIVYFVLFRSTFHVHIAKYDC